MKEFLKKIESYLNLWILYNICSKGSFELFKKVPLTDKELELFADRFPRYHYFWTILIEYQNLTESFLRKYIYRMALCECFRHQSVPEDLIKEIIDYVEKDLNSYPWGFWQNLFRHQNLSEEFLIENIDRIRNTTESDGSNSFQLNLKVDPKVKKNILSLIEVRESKV